MPSTSCPALPGVTPATTCVPYALHCVAWNEPSLPVIPCTTTRVLLLTRMLTINLSSFFPLSSLTRGNPFLRVAPSGRLLTHPPCPRRDTDLTHGARSGGPYTGRGCEHAWAARRQDPL